METEEHREAAESLIANVEDSYPGNRSSALAEATYTFSELGLWKMDVTIGAEEAIRVWAVVEQVRLNGFPKTLRM